MSDCTISEDGSVPEISFLFCNFGTQIGFLRATNMQVTINDEIVGTHPDKELGTNVSGFGGCVKTESGACTYQPGTWDPVDEKVTSGDLKTLRTDSEMRCTSEWGLINIFPLLGDLLVHAKGNHHNLTTTLVNLDEEMMEALGLFCLAPDLSVMDADGNGELDAEFDPISLISEEALVSFLGVDNPNPSAADVRQMMERFELLTGIGMPPGRLNGDTELSQLSEIDLVERLGIDFEGLSPDQRRAMATLMHKVGPEAMSEFSSNAGFGLRVDDVSFAEYLSSVTVLAQLAGVSAFTHFTPEQLETILGPSDLYHGMSGLGFLVDANEAVITGIMAGLELADGGSGLPPGGAGFGKFFSVIGIALSAPGIINEIDNGEFFNSVQDFAELGTLAVGIVGLFTGGIGLVVAGLILGGFALFLPDKGPRTVSDSVNDSLDYIEKQIRKQEDRERRRTISNPDYDVVYDRRRTIYVWDPLTPEQEARREAFDQLKKDVEDEQKRQEEAAKAERERIEREEYLASIYPAVPNPGVPVETPTPVVSNTGIPEGLGLGPGQGTTEPEPTPSPIPEPTATPEPIQAPDYGSIVPLPPPAPEAEPNPGAPAPTPTPMTGAVPSPTPEPTRTPTPGP